MAKQRSKSSSFWRDGYISELTPEAKLLFDYCLSAPDSNLCGIYQCPLKIIVADTGIKTDDVLKLFAKFEKEHKIKYQSGWIAVKNRVKHQKTENPQINACIKKELESSPIDLKEWVIDESYMWHADKSIDIDISIDKDIRADESEIYDFWNNCSNLTKHKTIAPHRSAISTALNKYSVDDIKTAIAQYNRITNHPMSLFSHKWILKDFLKRGLDRFAAGTPDNNFIKKNADGKRQYQDWHKEMS